MMNKIFYTLVAAFFVVITQIGCDDADVLLSQYIEDGPIVYAGRIEELNVKSGYQKVGVRILPAEDANRAYCMLRWNTGSGMQDSARVGYIPENYSVDFEGYYTVLDMSSIEGNVLIEAWNVDIFGNRSLITDQGAFVYGSTYVSTLLNTPVDFSPTSDEVIFESRIGSVGNLLSYEQNDGQFTEEVIVRTARYPLEDAKSGGIVRTKTRYLMTETDIDTLVTSEYLETVIP